jgi:hypothetical protein
MICRYPADWVAPHTSLKSRQRMRHASTCHHIPYSSELCPLARVGSDATTCPMAPDPAPCWGGLRCCHVFYSSGPHLQIEVGPDVATCPRGFGPCLPAGESSGAAECSMAPDIASQPGRASVLPCILRFLIGCGPQV